MKRAIFSLMVSVVCSACGGSDDTAGDANEHPDGGGTGASSGAGGSGSGTSTGGSPGSGGTPGTDASPPSSQGFEERCAQPGVVRCVAFDSPSDIAGKVGNPTGSMAGSLAAPEIDTTTSASGAGSLLFTTAEHGGSDTTGSFFANFSDDFDTQFDGGEEFFVQWRQRFSKEYIDTIFEAEDGGETAWKQVIIGTGDKPGCNPSNTLNFEDYPGQGFCAYSCTALEVVTVRNYADKYPIMYNSCTGSSSHGPYDPFTEPFGEYDFKVQNGMADPFCTYHEQSDGTHGNCFYYQPDEWMTFQVHIKLGPRVGDEFVGSVVELFGAREGQKSVRVVAWGDVAGGHPAYNLSAGDPATNQTYGKVWLVPYMTNKSSTQNHPEAKTWYDELIVSRNVIADP